MKYRITDETAKWKGVEIHRIKASDNFTLANGTEIIAGTPGGWIEKESNLSQDGDCWIADDAIVWDNAMVSGNALVCDCARVYGQAKVYGNAQICDFAKVYDNAKVYGENSLVSGHANVYENAKVFGKAGIYNSCKICGNAKISGEAGIEDEVKISGDLVINGHIVISSEGIIKDVASVVHGKWIDILEREVYLIDEKTTISLVEEKCSQCGVVTTFKGTKLYLADFMCPNCGTIMDLE